MKKAYSEESAIQFNEQNIVSVIESEKYGKVEVIFLNGYLYAFFSEQPGNMFIPAGRSKIKKTDLKNAIKKIESYISEDKISGVFEKVKNQMTTQTFSLALSGEDISLSLSLLKKLPKDDHSGVFIHDSQLCVISGRHSAFTHSEKENTPMFSEEVLRKHPYIYGGVIDNKKKFFCEKDTNISSREISALTLEYPEESILFKSSDNLVPGELILELIKKVSIFNTEENPISINIERKKDVLTLYSDNLRTCVLATVPVPLGNDFVRTLPAACIQESLVELIVSKEGTKLVHEEGASFIIDASYVIPVSTGAFEPLEENNIAASFTYRNSSLPEGKGNLVVKIENGIATLRRKRGRESVEIPLDEGYTIASKKVTFLEDDMNLMFNGEDVRISLQERAGSDTFFSFDNIKFSMSELILASSSEQ